MSTRLPIAYFIVRGAARERIEAVFARGVSARKEWAKFADRFAPGTKTWSSGSTFGSRLVGLEFPADAPDGWKRKSGAAFHVPDKRTAVGRRAAKEFDALPTAHAHEAIQAACMDVPPGQSLILIPATDEGCIHLALAAIYGDECVVGVYHLDGKEPIAPHDSERIPTSRYWQLREAHEAAKKAAKDGTP